MAGYPADATDIQLDATEARPMNNQRLGKLLQTHFPKAKIEGQAGLWRIPLAEDKPAELDDENEKPVAEKLQDAAPDENQNGQPQENDLAEPEAGPGATDHLPPVMLVMTDERADRMRLMIPIRRFDAQKMEDLQLALIALHANYDRALDARYATHDGLLWSAFIHPLSSLTPNDLSSAIEQVRSLRDNTGTTYSSSQFIFAPKVGGEGEGDAPSDDSEPEEGPSDDSEPEEGPSDNVT
ncbi:MAG: hypothetical protein AAGD11_15705 [Planctomycetota bacterium]